MENEIILELKQKLLEIENFSGENYPNKLEHSLTEILNLINQLSITTKNKLTKIDCASTSLALGHTLSKEVKYLKNAYERAFEKKSAKIRIKEYKKLRDGIIFRIQSELYSLINQKVN